MTNANHLELLDRLTTSWDAVMIELDGMPEEAIDRHPANLAAQACYLKILTEVARCATAARDDLARKMRDLARDTPQAQRSCLPGVGSIEAHPWGAEVL